MGGAFDFSSCSSIQCLRPMETHCTQTEGYEIFRGILDGIRKLFNSASVHVARSVIR